MSSAADHFNTDFSTTCNKNTTLFGPHEANSPSWLSQHVCPWVIKLSFSNKFFSDQWLRYALINMISTHSWCEIRDSGAQTSLVKWLPGYQADLLHRFPTLYFRSNFVVFISIVGFSNGDNCCHSQGIGKSIKDKLFIKGIFRVE